MIEAYCYVQEVDLSDLWGISTQPIQKKLNITLMFLFQKEHFVQRKATINHHMEERDQQERLEVTLLHPVQNSARNDQTPQLKTALCDELHSVTHCTL